MHLLKAGFARYIAACQMRRATTNPNDWDQPNRLRFMLAPRMSRGSRIIAAIGGVLAMLAMGEIRAAAAAKIDFNREIRPILSDNCFACHGPDDKQRKGGLRFDVREDALKPAKSGEIAIVPGHPEKSTLIARIETHDEDDLMPPTKTGKKLSSAQIDILKRWIGEGASYSTHWSFLRAERPKLPEVKDTAWPRNEVDRFVLARLEQEKLSPSASADPRTLARRVTLDATGLPPTPTEVEAYLTDSDPKAYERLVDRLLDSPKYGENMARYWLDAARYADSHGYHIDSERSIWKYRDWTVKAYNRNLPFDQFTREQLAGDLLPEATLDQRIASGYVRCNMSTGEGGAIEEEYRAKYAFDRTETMGTMWLGLTLTCARCHTHKYDPIQHTEYYQLYSFFNSLAEPVMDGNKPNPDPFIKVPSPEQSERLAWLKQSIEAGQKKLESPLPELDEKQPAWQAKWHERLQSSWSAVPLKGLSVSAPVKVTEPSENAVLVEAPKPDREVYELTVALPPGPLAGLRLEPLPHESLPKKGSGRASDGTFTLSEIEAELIPPPAADGKQPNTEALKFELAAADDAAEDQGVQRAIDGKIETGWNPGDKKVGSPHRAIFLMKEPRDIVAGTQLRVRMRFPAAERRSLGHFRLSAAREPNLLAALFPAKIEDWRMIGPFSAPDPVAGLKEAFPPEKELAFGKTYPGVRDAIGWNVRSDLQDGRSQDFVSELHGVHGAFYFHRKLTVATPQKMEVSLLADDLIRVFLNGRLVAERAEKSSEAVRATLDLAAGENQLLVKVVNRQGACRFRFDKFLMDDEAIPTPVAAILAATAEPQGGAATTVRNHYRAIRSPEWKKTSEDLAAWRDETDALDRAIPTTIVAKESSSARETFVLMRGEYDKQGEKVGPGVPAFLSPFPAGAALNRLGLAEWLVSRDQPLTARVVVNQFWQQYFGVGLVKTAEDFGVQGEHPSHPELLDWLAVEFMESGWNMKHLQRLILTSATYRQTSAASPELRARDPENRLLARGPRFRLDAEALRDAALSVSGLLVEEFGGRSVRPYQPPGLWEAVSFNNSQKYEQDRGAANYRRSLYTHWKRQSPPPNLMIFDAPTREYCVVRRPRTNTPLQALTLLNDPQFVDASRSFARRILEHGGSQSGTRIAYAFEMATARPPAKDEVAVLEQAIEEQLRAYAADPDAAAKLALAEKGTSRERVSELAAWTTVASMLLNLDETMTKN